MVKQRVVKATKKMMDNTANPAPLGLMAFGLTTVLLNLHNAGFFSLGTMILATGLFYGGLAQVIAGVMEWRKGNTFGTTAFTSYGFFWISLVTLMVMPVLSLGSAPESAAMGSYLFMWGIFTCGMFIGTLKLNRALQFVFASLALLFFLLALGNFTGNQTILTIAGYEGIICGLSAVYTSFATLLNEVYKKEILPVCAVK
jgi:succinate-acetate transporter protein